MPLSRRVVATILVCLFATQNASAFQGFSRACKWLDLRPDIRVYAVSTFGLQLNGVFLTHLPESTQQTLIAQESLTVNYGNAERLFLIAFSSHYAWNKTTGQGFREAYYVSDWDDTGYWDTQRGFLFSARAGFGGTNLTAIFESKSQNYDYMAVGTHGSWNGVTQTLVIGNNSAASDCNCRQWGLEWDAMNRMVGAMVC